MKNYTKPDLYYESFTMIDHIASCNMKALSAENVCGGLLDNGFTQIGMFSGAMSGCDVSPQDGASVCYAVGADGYVIFGS